MKTERKIDFRKCGFFFLFLFLFFSKGAGATSEPFFKGIGLCHWFNNYLDSVINWGYDQTARVHWKTLEPSLGVYDFSSLDNLITPHIGKGRKIGLAIQSVAGNRASPLWLDDLGAEWFPIIRSYGDDGLFAPWDPVYLERFEILLSKVNEHLESQSVEYQNTVGGIMMMSGGMYGEMQVWSGGAEAILAGSLGLENNLYAFRKEYYNAVLNLVDLYLGIFKRWPVVLRLGYDYPFNHPETGVLITVDEAVVEKKVPEYGPRLILKWCGLGPDNGSCTNQRLTETLEECRTRENEVRRGNNESYQRLFLNFNTQTQVGFEIGHPAAFQEPAYSGPYLAERFINVLNWALDSGASFVCFQPEMLSGLKAVSNWESFDQDLEDAFIPPWPTTITPIPTLPPEECVCTNALARPFHAKGDGNCDGKTDLVDYNYWVESFIRRNKAYDENADFNCNGVVNISDYGFWSSNFDF